MIAISVAVVFVFVFTVILTILLEERKIARLHEKWLKEKSFEVSNAHTTSFHQGWDDCAKYMLEFEGSNESLHNVLKAMLKTEK